jgi:hypothetical protein
MTTDHNPHSAWVKLPDNCHACLIYDDTPKRDAIVSAYLGAGLREGQLVRYYTDVTPVEVVQCWATHDGVQMKATEDGPLRVIEAERAYCPEGRFEPQKVVARLPIGYDLARAAGFTGVRSSGEMTWALRGIPGSDRLVEYEALLNTMSSAVPHLGMCQYDARQFDGATLFQVLRVHPYLVAGEQVVRNPYFDGPEAVLAATGRAR